MSNEQREHDVIEWIDEAYLNGWIDQDMMIGDTDWYYGHTTYAFSEPHEEWGYTGYWALNVSTTGSKTLIEFNTESEWRKDMADRDELYSIYLNDEAGNV